MPLKIAIFEFICGSGTFRTLASEEPSTSSNNDQWSSLLNEGLAMLVALADDMLQCGIEVHTVLEPSIATKRMGKDRVSQEWHWTPILYSSTRTVDEIAEQWVEASRRMDAVIVIAPELDGTLERILSIMRNAGVSVLAGDSRFIQTACDQWHTCNAWQSAGVRHPKTWLLSDFMSERKAIPHSGIQQSCIEHSGAWVVKRRDSAGCVGQRRYRDLVSLLEDVSQSTELASDRDRWIVQPWISGSPASLAILCHETGPHETGPHEARPHEAQSVLGCFEQHIDTITEGDATGFGYCGFGYAGGTGPVEGISHDRLREFAGRALDALPGQPRGWIGIDFIIEPDGSWTALEVNPRLTSSYLGYRKWYGPELAKSWFRGIPPRGLGKEFPRVSFSLENWER